MHTAYSLKPHLQYFSNQYIMIVLQTNSTSDWAIFWGIFTLCGSFTYWNVDNGGHFRVVIS
jgi:hypothetical protein